MRRRRGAARQVGPSLASVRASRFVASTGTAGLYFMPLASADPFGGVILTDWYSAPETQNERIKLNVFILDKQLRSDGVQVKVFKQEKRGGEWRDAAVSDDTGRSIEDAILTRARQMRVAKVGTPRK